jgi:acetyltransferase
VQAMSRGGIEVIIGAKKDRTFGPAIMFGMGGTGVELYRDVAVDFPPLNQALASTLIGETKVAKLLRGWRGSAAVDMEALEQTLVKASYLLVDFPEISEMDVNPLQVRPDGLAALDARVMIEPSEAGTPGSHLIISMYPSKYHWDTTIDDEQVELRAIRPEDEDLWREMIESLSDETVQQRFFGPVKEITKSMLVRYCHIDYDREIAIVAIGGKGAEKQMLGVARLTIENSNAEKGEFAIVVRDSYQRRGLGDALMGALIEAARDQSVAEISGQVPTGNDGMVGFATSLGFELNPSDDPEIRTMVLRV